MLKSFVENKTMLCSMTLSKKVQEEKLTFFLKKTFCFSLKKIKRNTSFTMLEWGVIECDIPPPLYQWRSGLPIPTQLLFGDFWRLLNFFLADFLIRTLSGHTF